MIGIDKHISRLIAEHECVIVPGLGAFLSGHVPAYYDMTEQVFIPPRRTLGFNPQVVVDDALLVTEYMKFFGISYKQASVLMKDDINKLKKKLSRKGQVYLGDLGLLSMNINGEISFNPSENGIDDPENYGMLPFGISLLDCKEEKRIVIPIGRARIAQYIAAAAVIIMMFVFVTPLSDHRFKNNIKASFGDFASPEQISMMQQIGAQVPSAKTSESKCEILPIEQIDRNTVSSDKSSESIEVYSENKKHEIQQTETVVETNDKMYYVIVASTPDKKNAERAVTELSEKALLEYMILESNGRYRISAGQYPTSQSAKDALNNIKSTFSDAWVLAF